MKDFLQVRDGEFTLNGKPYFLHLATYFGRRPGTCGADWMGEHFEYNMNYLDGDIARLRDLGMSGFFAFVPAGLCFDERLNPVRWRLDQVSRFLDKMAAGDMQVLFLDHRYIEQAAWCALGNVPPGDMPWTPALNPEAEKCKITASAKFRMHFADRPEVIGWMTRSNRFLDGGHAPEQMRRAWGSWLQRRFRGDFEALRAAIPLSPEETDWRYVELPIYMPDGMSANNPRSYELSLMQQQLVTNSTNRMIRELRKVTPKQLIFSDIEGCDFSNGHLTWYIPEELEADAILHEYYHWEGTRSHRMTDGAMPEPVPDKPSVEITGAIGYVCMLTRRLRCAGLPVVMTHGVDIGGKKRGVYSEEEQRLIIDRYNRAFVSAGGNGVCYWCWTDDELSKTYTRKMLGMEFDADENREDKAYQQAGETMGILRYDGSYRPVCAEIRKLSRRTAEGVGDPVPDVCMLMPSPVFYSNYRYRANQSVFGMLNSLARMGISTDSRFTSSGEALIDSALLDNYRLIILSASTYRRDHPEICGILLSYVKRGGNLFFALDRHDVLTDPYLRDIHSDALRALSGCVSSVKIPCPELSNILANSALPVSKYWSIRHDEPVFFVETLLPESAEVLATANGKPLLYRHFIGKGSVYIFTWNLDLFMFKGDEMDHYDMGFDWLWDVIGTGLSLKREPDNEMKRVLFEITSMPKREWALMTF